MSSILFLLCVYSTLKQFPNKKYNVTFSAEKSTQHRRAIIARRNKCYLQFFKGDQPPKGLLSSLAGIQYICQRLPDIKKTSSFATMFDTKTGNAVFSAYTVTARQSKNIGKYERRAVSQLWRGEEGLSRYFGGKCGII